MKTSVKMALAAGALAVTGALVLAGSSYAERAFGGHRMMMGGMGGHGGHGGMLMREMLRDIDANGDAALSQEEIDAALDTRFGEFDANADGALSLEEFQALWAEITRPIAVRAFQFLDPDGDAAIARAELDDRFGSAVAHLDRNDDGVLDRNDHRHAGWRHGRRDSDGPQDRE
jgi:hypothetical protein